MVNNKDNIADKNIDWKRSEKGVIIPQDYKDNRNKIVGFARALEDKNENSKRS